MLLHLTSTTFLDLKEHFWAIDDIWAFPQTGRKFFHNDFDVTFFEDPALWSILTLDHKLTLFDHPNKTQLSQLRLFKNVSQKETWQQYDHCTAEFRKLFDYRKITKKNQNKKENWQILTRSERLLTPSYILGQQKILSSPQEHTNRLPNKSSTVSFHFQMTRWIHATFIWVRQESKLALKSSTLSTILEVLIFQRKWNPTTTKYRRVSHRFIQVSNVLLLKIGLSP